MHSSNAFIASSSYPPLLHSSSSSAAVSIVAAADREVMASSTSASTATTAASSATTLGSVSVPICMIPNEQSPHNFLRVWSSKNTGLNIAIFLSPLYDLPQLRFLSRDMKKQISECAALVRWTRHHWPSSEPLNDRPAAGPGIERWREWRRLHPHSAFAPIVLEDWIMREPVPMNFPLTSEFYHKARYPNTVQSMAEKEDMQWLQERSELRIDWSESADTLSSDDTGIAGPVATDDADREQYRRWLHRFFIEFHPKHLTYLQLYERNHSLRLCMTRLIAQWADADATPSFRLLPSLQTLTIELDEVLDVHLPQRDMSDRVVSLRPLIRLLPRLTSLQLHRCAEDDRLNAEINQWNERRATRRQQGYDVPNLTLSFPTPFPIEYNSPWRRKRITF